jgi:hypothetical protein
VRRRGIAAAFIVALVSPVLAEGVLPIGGAFGNEAGCHLFMTGEKQDGTLLLTPDTFTLDSGACYFKELLEPEFEEFYPGAAVFLVKVGCTWEGGHSNEDELTVIDGEEGLTVGFRIRDVFWGPLDRCPGTEELFAPLGVQI